MLLPGSDAANSRALETAPSTPSTWSRSALSEVFCGSRMTALHETDRGVSVAVRLAVLAMVPVVAILLPDWPANIGLGPYGAAASPSPTTHQSNPFGVAMTALFRASHSFDFWLLALSFAICGLSTNGLINTHLIAYCADRGISEVAGAGILASLGVFSLIGATASIRA